MAEINRNCELCNQQASLFCPSDNAFLCHACDSKVHRANFLVARHVRFVTCPNCRKMDGGSITGVGFTAPMNYFCDNCSPSDDDSMSSCSSCVSSTGEGAGDEAQTTSSSTKNKKSGYVVRRRVKGMVVTDLKLEGILLNWCSKMEIAEEAKFGQVVTMAVELLTGCLDKITILPFRVSLAAAFWIAIKVCNRRNGAFYSSTCQDLKRVEQISGVPVKLILAAEAKIVRVVKRRRSSDNHEEGWAES
ncbi:B-box zinc finger protein 32-like [Amaranthus tricolor]|uniref:B-box zinc finger protein 32-like n=1 Tax=Amaranthus tricolor TaxID=29722 RepID=UPI00258FE256|nr:B-box zinc finger protein 32-like [Amaranthus tricolor]